MGAGNGAINGKAIRPFSSSPSSSSLSRLLSSSTSTSFLLSLSPLLLSLLSKISPYFCLVRAFSFPFNPTVPRRGAASASSAQGNAFRGHPEPCCRGPSPAAKMTRNGVKPQIGARNRAPARLEVEMPAARRAPRRPRISLLHFYRPFSFFSPFFKPRAPLVVCFSPSRSPHTGGDPWVPAIGVRPPRGTLLLAGRFGDLGTCLGFAAFS